MASVEPGAERGELAQRRRVASLVRYMLTPVDATTAGLSGVEAGGQRAHPTTTRRISKSTGTRRSQSGTPKPSSTRRAASTPGCPAGRPRRSCRREAEVGPALGERVEAGAEDDVLADAAAACSATRSSMKRARATIEARNPPVPAGCMSRPVAPAVVGRGQLQTDRVVEHVRRRVDLDVQRPPQRDAHRGAVRAAAAVGGHRRACRRRLQAPHAAVGVAHRHLPGAPVRVLERR